MRASRQTPGRRKREDVKSITPVDKEELKSRCLKRVKAQRRRLVDSLRSRRGGFPVPGASPGGPSPFPAPHTRGADGGVCVFMAEEILRYELDPSHSTQTCRPAGLGTDASSPGTPTAWPGRRPDSSDAGEEGLALHGAASEEGAYRRACGLKRPLDPRLASPSPPRVPDRPDGEAGSSHSPEELATASGAGGGFTGCFETPGPGTGAGQGSGQGVGFAAELAGGERDMEDDSDEDDLASLGRALSAEEYEEMMQFIEQAIQDEMAQAEAEALEEYERHRNAEEQALASTVSDYEKLQEAEADGVLCPVCEANWLLLHVHGARGGSILCRCGLRVFLGEDTVGMTLGYMREQLAEAYAVHGASCHLKPRFDVKEEFGGSPILWSSCASCGFNQVVV